MKRYLKDYCVGCGLCQALEKARLVEDEKGYLHPVNGDDKWLASVCPAGGTQKRDMDFSKIWGVSEGVYYGWSTDEVLRKKASSGGALTEIASFLLETGRVDAVLHTCMSHDNPTETEICISTSRKQLIERCGSRYAISHPLSNFNNLDQTKKYVFIGKPCDITALKNYMRINPYVSDMIPYTLSFFCAGLPSKVAQKKLLDEMGVDEKVSDLCYRGNGWPGMATAVEESGKIHQLDYDTSWGKILGRDIMKMCRFCLDGIGELADISCCDAWYLTEDGQPDFSEAQGRNAIICRTVEGKKLVDDLIKAQQLDVEDFTDYRDKMLHMQKYQYERRATMKAKILAMNIFFRPVPHYGNKVIRYAKYVSLSNQLKNFKGTVSRIIKGRI